MLYPKGFGITCNSPVAQSLIPFFSLAVSRNPSGSEDSAAIFDGMRANSARSPQQNCTNAGTNGDNGPREIPLKKGKTSCEGE